jgi:SAM-dependent methyltransferase
VQVKERIAYEACPLCDSADIAFFKKGDCSRHPLYDDRLSPVINWMRCNSCTHVFTDGYFSPQACEILFSKTHDHQKVGAQIERNRAVAARMIDKVLPFVEDGVWLDIGVGNGALLFTAQEYGFRPVGTDLRSENVSLLKSLMIEAHQCDILDLQLAEPCSVVSMADVLEHMPYPKLALEVANRLTRDGGVVLVSMPNSESMLWKALSGNNANPYWGEIEHYHNFGRARLYALLEQFGFVPRRYGISERYRVCMEVVAQKVAAVR